MAKHETTPKEDAEDLVSLAPLEVTEALKALLKVKPEPEPEKED